MIRRFEVDDIDQVIGLLEHLRQQTPYRCINPHWPTIVNTITVASSKRAGCVLVAEHNQKITGIIIAVAQTLWWQEERTGARVASDLIFYSQRLGDGKRLLEAMTEWAFSVPRVVRIECGISSGEDVDRVESIYLSCGFVKEGTMFIRNHPKYEAALAGQKVSS